MRFSEPPPTPERPLRSNKNAIITATAFIVALIGAHVTTVLIIGLNQEAESENDNSSSINTITLSSPPHDLRYDCDDDVISRREGWERCRTLCNDVGCCFPNSGEESCASRNREVCEEYSPCEIFYEESGDANGNGNVVEIPPAPGSISVTCSVGNIGTIDGLKECVNICFHAECCTADNDEENCYNDNRDTCDGYGACHAVLSSTKKDNNTTSTTTLGNPGDDVAGSDVTTTYDDETYLTHQDMKLFIHSACTEEGVASGTTRKACVSFCLKKHCCIDWICADESVCDGFEPCTVISELGITIDEDAIDAQDQYKIINDDMVDDDDDVTDSKDDAADESSESEDASSSEDDVVSLMGAIKVSKDEESLESEDDSSSSSEDDILSFKDESVDSQDISLSDMIDDEFDFQDSLDIPVDVIYDPAIKQMVDKTCDKKIFDNPDELMECKSICSSRLCCFLRGSTSCKEDRKDECEIYDACKILMPDTSVYADDNDKALSDNEAFVKDMVDKTCDEDMYNIPEEFEKCKQFCDSNWCCFEDGADSCKDKRDGKFSCRVYESCKIFLEENDDESGRSDENNEPAYGSTEVKALVDELCDVDVFHIPEDFNECTELCHHNMCCFEEGVNNCKDNRQGKYGCEVYESCKFLIDYQGDPHDRKSREEHEIKALIDETCDNDVFHDPDHYSYCKAMCDPSLCCLKHDDTNCENDRDGKYPCSIYESCGILVDDDGNKPLVDNNDKFGSEEVKAIIDGICDEVGIQDEDQFNECKEICEVNKCCFETDKTSCVDDRLGKYGCEVYESCQVLFETRRTRLRAR